MTDQNELLLSSHIKKALAASDAKDYDAAQKSILQAAECALLLAKKSTGKKKEDYFAKYKDLKKMLESVTAKKSAAAKSSDAPKAPEHDDNFVAPEKDPPQSDESGKEHEKEPAANKPPKSDSLAPKWLSEYIGQPQAVTAVRDLIRAAGLKNSALPHLILYGSHGLGKTTFARIIANEMHVGFTEINVTKITATEMIAILKKIKPRDIIFIDEIHTLPLIVAESVLYSAMQDGTVTYTEGKGKFARTQKLVLPPFTLIGATTEIGKLAKPFTQRAIQVRLVEYSDEVLGGIITNAFYKLGMKISGELGVYIAKRCRNNPRIANNTVRRISDKALVRYAAMNNLKEAGSMSTPEAVRKLGIEVTQNVVDDFFDENGIDEYGLEKGDRELLRIIVTRYNGGPVGLDTLARVMNEANNVIAQKYEAYLIKCGMLKIEREGRVVMPLAYTALGLPVPDNADCRQDKPDEPEKTDDDEEKKSKYDTRKIVACKVPDERKCEKIDELITYPENAGEFEQSLDELFPDIEKPYDAETKHLCKLEIDFGEHKRMIICDSFLESRFATSMAVSGYLRDMKAQTVELPYVSQELANRRYFPDFVTKDQKGRIAVIEMKNFEMVSYHLNIDKYEMLKNYCIAHGYGYAEVMKGFGSDRYISAEMIKALPKNEKLERFVIDRIEQNGNESGEGVFTKADFADYVAQNGATDVTELYSILLNNRALKNIDRSGNEIRIVSNE